MTPYPSPFTYPSPSLFPAKTSQTSTVTSSSSESDLVEITDEFDNPRGEWANYDAIILEQRNQLRSQRHVNIRSFESAKITSPVNMFFMDRLTMFYLDSQEIAAIAVNVVVKNNEGWTFGEVGPQEDRDNWNGIAVECEKEVTTATQSIITQNG